MDEQNKNQNQPQPVAPQPNQVKGKNTGMAVVSYILFFVPLLTDAKNDIFVKFHVKQGFLVFLLALVSWAISFVPIFGLLAIPLNIAVIIFMILGIINALEGKEKELPLIGQYAVKLNF